MSFTHFSPSIFTFLKELQRNNRREWFHENKQRFKDDVEEPMLAFIAALSGPLSKVNPNFIAEPRTNGGSLFRIYRDTRFAKDKTPYKEHVACRFWHSSGRDVHGPCFYAHLSPSSIMLGAGIWMPKPNDLLSVRERISENPEHWQKVISNKRFIKTYGKITGDGLKRAPRGFDPEHKFVDDLKRKSFFAIHECETSVALDPQWMKFVSDSYKAATPLTEFICKALGRAH